MEIKMDRMKHKLDTILSQHANADLFPGQQIVDEEVIIRFDELFGRIKTWSAKFTRKEQQELVALDAQIYEMCGQVNEWCDNHQGLMDVLQDCKGRQLFARGLVARFLCDNIFRSLSVEREPAAKGSDYWLEDEVRGHFEAIEDGIFLALQASLASDGATMSPAISYREYNDWRAITTNLLGKIHTQNTERFAGGTLNTLTSLVDQVLGPWEMEESSGYENLTDILKDAIDFSRDLRYQRPCWSVALPEVPIKTALEDNVDDLGEGSTHNNFDLQRDTQIPPPVPAKDPPRRPPRKITKPLPSQGEEAVTHADVATSTPEHESVEAQNPTLKGGILFFLIPHLYKRGDLGGGQFDDEEKVRQAKEVRWVKNGS
ncbi:hypothetical protein B0H67DRAFT_320736 [Lasiosphaeris hirsuta]|uniref:Uncharacterized protein n=1 Tax=Lasiosphaeris hirsuta TaxID=260670 RepID=A0AA40A1T0_9PEZI|nr:hypothetical protein B0H67DRAFT_320736 [Lasiosphaeris hirsuta]